MTFRGNTSTGCAPDGRPQRHVRRARGDGFGSVPRLGRLGCCLALLLIAGCASRRAGPANQDTGPYANLGVAAPQVSDGTTAPIVSDGTATPPSFQNASWQQPPQRAQYQPAITEQVPPPSAGSTIEPTRLVARVGNEPILAGDVLGPINQALAQYEGKVPADQLDAQREALLRQQLPALVEIKMLYLAYLRNNIPANKLDEALPQIWRRVHEKFDEEELPKLKEKYQVQSDVDLDAVLRQYGWSLAKQRRFYGERALGMAGAFQAIETKPEITHDEMLQYYLEHAADFSYQAQARWEQLTVRFDRFPNREAAWQALAQMGNEVALGGAPFGSVAKRSSHGFTAEQGGVHDWTNQGSLASNALDRAIFSLPPGELSNILEDQQGFHIVRVLERREAGRTPFTEAQLDIRKKLQDQKRDEAFKKYLADLRREIPVWTVYDGAIGEFAERP